MSMTTMGPKNRFRPVRMIAAGPILGRRAVMRPSLAPGADPECVIQATAGADALGFAAEDQPNVGDWVRVFDRAGDSIHVEAGGPYAVDARLATDALGRVVTALPGQRIVAIAMQAATAAGQLQPVRISRGMIAHS
jgi:hypothetical protein